MLSESITHSTGVPNDLTNFRMPSMPVHTLSRYLRNRNIRTDFINFFNFGKQHLEHLLRHDPPRCVGISSTCQVEPAPLRSVVNFVRNINPDPVIVIGGPYINSLNLEMEGVAQNYILKLMGADVYVHESQGEKTLYKICLELRKAKPDFSTIPNLIYYQDKQFHRTEKVSENVSLDEEPVTELTFYENHPLPAVYLRTSRSCPQQCAFCRYPLLGETPTYMSLENVEKNMNYIHSLGVNSIVFLDDSLNIPQDRFKNMLRMMIRNKYGFRWYSFFRCSHADTEEYYDLMAESGCAGVLLGIESGDTTILKNMNKQVTPEHYYWAIVQLNARDIISHASCMIGFPGETDYTVKKTMELLEVAQPTFYDLQTWFFENAVPIAKEREYWDLKNYGYSWSHKTMDWEEAADRVVEVIRLVENSCNMPSLSFNLWSLGYYFTQGLTLEEFKRFSRAFKMLIGKEANEIDDEHRENEKRILSVFGDNEALKENLLSRASVHDGEDTLYN